MGEGREGVDNDMIKEGLALQGGGILGAAQASMLKGICSIPRVRWKTMAGTSIGAFNGLLLAIGYSSSELYDLWANIKAGDLIKKRWRKWRSLYTRKPMRGFIESRLKERGFHKGITFKDLHDMTGVDLICAGTVVQTGRPLLLGRSYVDVPVVDAILMSTSYPTGFEPYVFDDPASGKKVQVMDGGILMNSPILPLVSEGCNHITLLSLGGIDESVWVKGTWSSFKRVLDFFTQGNEIASLSWAKSGGRQIDVYHASCVGVGVFDFDKIPGVLAEGARAIAGGLIDPERLISWLMGQDERIVALGDIRK